MGEGVDLDDLLVAELGSSAGAWKLCFSGDDIDGFDKTVGLVRIDAEIEVDLLALRESEGTGASAK